MRLLPRPFTLVPYFAKLPVIADCERSPAPVGAANSVQL